MGTRESPASCFKPHVLMLPFPLQGHITPLMQLSKLLAARGFIITFVTTEFNLGKMLQVKQNLLVNDLITKLGIRLLGIPDSPPHVPPRDLTCDPEAFLASLLFLRTSFDELLKKLVQVQGLHITAIISDSFLLWSQDVADNWCIPRVSFWPQSLTAFACSISLPRIREAYPNMDPFKEEVYKGEGCMLNCIPGLCDFEACRLPFFTLAGEVCAKWLRDHVRVQMDRVNEPLCIICNTFLDLEGEILMHLKAPFLSKPLFTVGPLLPSTFMGGEDGSNDKGTASSLYNEDEECMQWLDGQRPRSILYISLGSLSIFEERDVCEIAMGLEACKVPFLWVIRSATSDLTSVLQNAQGKVIQWAPQLRVLSHEAVGGFLTHCGWNSTLESICLGVPVIGWPQMMDQNTNCWLQVEKLKVGLQLELDTASRVQHVGVEKAVRSLMLEEEDSHMRTRASNFSFLAQNAYATSLASNLDSLVHTILTSTTSLPSFQSQ
ncbi:hypothetical protein L7F22_035000 [Adiantum nelumboides]|nr:hypothetical protein [Adiantum nelumboides]